MTCWILLYLSTLIVSFCLARVIIHKLGQQLLDIPNSRSSHQKPIPRGGGIAITVATLLSVVCLWLYAPTQAPAFFLVALPIIMAVLGAADDFLSLNIKPRLFVQFVLALGGAYFCLYTLDLGLPGMVFIGALTLIGLMWATNLYNFMDGINGIAALQAISTCFTMGIILYWCDVNAGIAQLLAIIAFANAGFIYWNFPKAKIFMGDTGSLFLGFTFGLVALETSLNSLEIAAAWLISMAIFISDATYTLCIRLLSGQQFYLPHRSHCYQKLAITLGSHTKTTLLVLGVNMVWLFPLALLTALSLLHPLLSLILAYSPLIIIAVKLRAGRQI